MLFAANIPGHCYHASVRLIGSGRIYFPRWSKIRFCNILVGNLHVDLFSFRPSFVGFTRLQYGFELINKSTSVNLIFSRFPIFTSNILIFGRLMFNDFQFNNTILRNKHKQNYNVFVCGFFFCFLYRTRHRESSYKLCLTRVRYTYIYIFFFSSFK